MSVRTRRWIRDLIGYTVIAVALYLAYLTGSEEYTLSWPIIFLIGFILIIIFEKIEDTTGLAESATGLVEAINSVTDLEVNSDDDTSGERNDDDDGE